MDFYKYHGLGNDYIVIDPQKTFLKLTPENIKLICHRNYGIGSDGILYGPKFENDTVFFHIYNSDGTEAEKSGNGIRIFARYLIDENYRMESKFELETKGGTVAVEVLDKETGTMKVDMGTYTMKSSEIPVAGDDREIIDEAISVDGTEYKMTCVGVGNPHCVFHLDSVSEEAARKMGPIIENHEMFPNRINMQIVKVIDKNKIEVQIWERGSGYTLSSGTSSCAAAIASFKKGLVDSKVTVKMPGGEIEVEIGESGHVFIVGSVVSVAEGTFTYEMWKRIAE